MKTKNKFPYEWTLKEASFTKDKGKVFSCFSCGGGSTMGYKLAGFDVIGCNEIDPKMMGAYIENHNPRFPFLESIETFKDRKDLPAELYDLDILDGSPPCSSFSMSGSREKEWGKEKKFREGQANQVLDRLFFDFIDLAKELQPRVVVAENVKGMLLGEATKYVNEILISFNEAGYYVNYKLLDASTMGVPQRRERVFFYAIRKDLHNGEFEDLFQTEPSLNLEFDERKIPFEKISTGEGKPVSAAIKELLTHRKESENCLAQTHERIHGKRKHFNTMINDGNKPCYTITSGSQVTFNGLYLCDAELKLCGTYPTDYNFLKNGVSYLIGMSVPPVMTAQVASRIYEQWLT